jgi:hypothetical protein
MCCQLNRNLNKELQTNNPQAKTPKWPEIAQLQKADLPELRTEYQKLFGKPSNSRNRKQLFNQIAQKLQETGQAVVKDSARKPARNSQVTAETQSGNSTLTAKFEPKRKRSVPRRPISKVKTPRQRQSRPVGATDPRLPKAGTTITKKYKGKTINVRVLEKGFTYDGKQYRSLSAVAKQVTGSIWNGYLFFGLIKRDGQKG